MWPPALRCECSPNHPFNNNANNCDDIILHPGIHH